VTLRGAGDEEYASIGMYVLKFPWMIGLCTLRDGCDAATIPVLTVEAEGVESLLWK